MTCEEVERDEIVEQYLLGRLEPAQEERFEDHYFDCPRCLERLRVVEEARAELARQATAAPSRRWRRAMIGLAAAAVLVLAIRTGLVIRSGNDGPSGSQSHGTDVATSAPARPSTSPVPPVPSSLGDVELPPYTPPRLRATPTEAQRVFRDAMTSYAAGDCGAAVPGLRRSLGMDDSLMQARFHLAVCDLQAGRIQDAVTNLQRVIAAGESPYLEDAHFFLAKARIRQGDVEGARQELTRVVSLRGDRRDQAERLLNQLR